MEAQAGLGVDRASAARARPLHGRSGSMGEEFHLGDEGFQPQDARDPKKPRCFQRISTSESGATNGS